MAFAHSETHETGGAKGAAENVVVRGAEGAKGVTEEDLAAAAEEDTMQGAGVGDEEGWGDEVLARDSARERARARERESE